jgi:hypothetical protein
MRIAKALAVLLIGVVVFSWIFGEAAVRYEMWSTGAIGRRELADDFGLGLLGMIVVQPLSVIGAAALAIPVWRSFRASAEQALAADAQKDARG